MRHLSLNINWIYRNIRERGDFFLYTFAKRDRVRGRYYSRDNPCSLAKLRGAGSARFSDKTDIVMTIKEFSFEINHANHKAYRPDDALPRLWYGGGMAADYDRVGGQR